MLSLDFEVGIFFTGSVFIGTGRLFINLYFNIQSIILISIFFFFFFMSDSCVS